MVTPTQGAKKRLKAKVKEMTKRKRFKDSPLLKFTALNAVLRGWIGYYCHSNAKKTALILGFLGQRALISLVAETTPPKTSPDYEDV